MEAMLLISHSKKITDGLREMIIEMIGDSENISIYSLGGTSDGRLGTDGLRIVEYLEMCKHFNNIYIFCDIGSSILSAETAIELADVNKDKVVLIDAPLVEGAFAASVALSIGATREMILSEINNI